MEPARNPPEAAGDKNETGDQIISFGEDADAYRDTHALGGSLGPIPVESQEALGAAPQSIPCRPGLFFQYSGCKAAHLPHSLSRISRFK